MTLVSISFCSFRLKGVVIIIRRFLSIRDPEDYAICLGQRPFMNLRVTDSYNFLVLFAFTVSNVFL